MRQATHQLVPATSTISIKNSPTAHTATIDAGGGRKLAKSRFILVQQGKPSDTIQVAQTLASFPGTISAQELQRTLGIKLEDLQAQGIIGIQAGGTGTRTIKLEELTGAVQVSGQTINAQVIHSLDVMNN